VVRKKIKLERWQLTCQFPTGQSPAWSSSDRHNYESRDSDQQTQGLTENKTFFIRKPHVVISRQSPFAANVVPKLVAMAKSLRPSISAMSSSDSLTPKTYSYLNRVASCHTTEVISIQNLHAPHPHTKGQPISDVGAGPLRVWYGRPHLGTD